MNAEPAEPALVVCPHCHGGACEDCSWQGFLPHELDEIDVLDNERSNGGSSLDHLIHGVVGR